MKQIANKLALLFLVLSIILGLCCRGKDQEPAEPKQKVTDPNVVATISDYTITKEELKKRLLTEIRPNPYEQNKGDAADAKTVLREMIAEKAMIIEGRKQNLLEDKDIKKSLTRFIESNLVNLLLSRYMQGKITVTEAEVDEKIKSDPKLDRKRVRAMLERAKGNMLFEQYYGGLYKKFHVQKMSDNFSQAALIHQRLLFRPQKPRKVGFIRIRQIEEELTEDEKEMILATYDGGKITLKDWFDALCELAPPSRPRDLNTAKGVEQLLERALTKPILVHEARLNGLDKDENLLKQIKEREDTSLLNKVRSDKMREITGPIAEEQIIAYFNKNKEDFGTENMLKVDQIWCQDLATARKAKAEADTGRDFESIKQKYSLEKKLKPYNISPGSEGLFFKDLWKGEPNEIVGPIKGFYTDGVKWRIVKILEKKLGEVKEYSDNMKTTVEMRMLDKQRKAIMEKYREDLLKKYPHEIYSERIKNIDPLEIP